MKEDFYYPKWAYNYEELLKDVSKDEQSNAALNLDKGEISETLDVKWNQVKTFEYSIEIKPHKVQTKRAILSSIAQIFNPLRLLTPVLITAKILMQTLRKLKVE